jgi:hypothetical protein
VHTLKPWHRLKRTPHGFQTLDAAGHVLRDVPAASFRSDLGAQPLAGRVALASWTNTGGEAWESFRCSWRVPPPPRTDSGQTIFLFSAIGSSGQERILQPVLQWRSPQLGAEAGWSIASWYVEPTGVALHTASIAVQPGEPLTALITVQGPGRRTFSCEFDGKSGTRLVVPDLPDLTWFAMALEAYGVSRRTDYPDTRQTRFTSVTLQFAASAPRVAWRPAKRTNAFGETMTVTENSGTAAQMAANYGKTPPGQTASPDATAKKTAPRIRPLVQRILGSWVVFLVALVALFVTAVELEWHGTEQSFQTYAILLFALVALPPFLAGIIAKGALFGVLIDDRNRMSLGRFQVLCWFLLIMGSYFLMAIWNAHHGGHLPGVPNDLWALLGITNGSAVAGSMVLNPKRRLTQVVAQGKTDDSVTPDPDDAKQSVLHVRDTPAKASWTDLFFGEEESNKDTVDVSRLQQFTFTIILLFVFAGKVLDKLTGMTGGQLDMPDLDPSALGLLGITNISYLASKGAAKPPVAPT